MPLPPPTIKNIVSLQVEWNCSGEESAISEPKCACALTPTHPSITSLSSSTRQVYVEKGEGKEVRYI